MAYEKRPMDDDTILLFKNDEMRNDKDPKFRGQGKVSGRDVWASAWVNQSKSGQSYMKVKVRPKDEARRETSQRDTFPYDREDDPFAL